VYGGMDNIIYARDIKTGAELWNATIYDSSNSSNISRVSASWPSFSPNGDVVYISSHSPVGDRSIGCCCVHALDSSTGDALWVLCDAGSRIEVTNDGAMLVVYDSLESPYAISTINATNGSFILRPSPTYSEPLGVYFSALPFRDNRPPGANGYAGGHISLSPSGGAVYLATSTPQAQIVAFNTSNGSTMWTYELVENQVSGQVCGRSFKVCTL
jgi:outer membrane protein assembly factor BamB